MYLFPVLHEACTKQLYYYIVTEFELKEIF